LFICGNEELGYFNCEREKICILKSTIQKYIPESQLAIWWSGEWGEWVEQDQYLDEMVGWMWIFQGTEFFR
jgi:hypothetical protein